MGIVELLLGVVFALCVGIGFSLAPSALTAEEFWVARACFVIAACALCAAYIYWLYDGNRSVYSRIIFGIVVGILAIAGTAESIYWVNSRERAREQEPKSKASADAPNPPGRAALIPRPSPLDLVVDYRMVLLPLVLEPRTKAHILILREQDGTPWSFEGIENNRDVRLYWPDKAENLNKGRGILDDLWRCTVTNHAEKRIQDVVIAYKFTLSKPEDSKKVIGTGQRVVSIPALRPDESFTFYINNATKHLAIVDKPGTATVLVLGETNRRAIPLRSSKLTIEDVLPVLPLMAAERPVNDPKLTP